MCDETGQCRLKLHLFKRGLINGCICERCQNRQPQCSIWLWGSCWLMILSLGTVCHAAKWLSEFSIKLSITFCLKCRTAGGLNVGGCTLDHSWLHKGQCGSLFKSNLIMLPSKIRHMHWNNTVSSSKIALGLFHDWVTSDSWTGTVIIMNARLCVGKMKYECMFGLNVYQRKSVSWLLLAKL
jgi:hypothetical protein